MLVRAATPTAQAPGRQPAPLGSTGTEVALAGRAREPHPVQKEDPACAGAGSEELFPRVQELHHRHRVLIHAAFPAEVRLAQTLRLPAAELCAAVHARERPRLLRLASPWARTYCRHGGRGGPNSCVCAVSGCQPPPPRGGVETRRSPAKVGKGQQVYLAEELLELRRF